MTAPQSPRPAVEPCSRQGEATTPRIWMIEIPSGMTLLNANRRLHWAAKAAATRELREAAFYLVKAAKIPHLERARIDCTYYPPRRGRFDAGNWHDTAKPRVDGVVDAGVLADDSSAYLEGPFMHIGEVRPGGAFCLTITELPEENSHV
jgi:crossover junction endodeoxyribonuclease RusA